MHQSFAMKAVVRWCFSVDTILPSNVAQVVCSINIKVEEISYLLHRVKNIELGQFGH